MQDLFKSPSLLPDDVRAVVESFSESENDYESCKQLENALQPLGYTFDWGLDAEPTLLRKITPEEAKFKRAVIELMKFDYNGAWDEIEDQCPGDYVDAYGILVRDLGKVIQQNKQAAPLYEAVLESLVTQ